MTIRPQKGARRLVVVDQTWWWMVGNLTILWTPKGQKLLVNNMALTGLTQETIERGRWKRTTDGTVTPRMVREYIDGLNSGVLKPCTQRAEAWEQGRQVVETLREKYRALVPVPAPKPSPPRRKHTLIGGCFWSVSTRYAFKDWGGSGKELGFRCNRR